MGARHFVVAGVALYRDTVERTRYALSRWRKAGSITSANNGSTGSATIRSMFVEDGFAVADRFKLYTGRRLDRWETRGDFFQNTAPAGSAGRWCAKYAGPRV